MEWSFVHVFPPNYPNQIRLGWSPPLATSSHVLHMCLNMDWFHFPKKLLFMFHLGMYTYCPKDPHYVLGNYLIYMIILNDHVLWY